MNNTVLWGVLAGFIAGTFGYTFINFYWVPVSAYKKIRGKMDEDLDTLLVSSRKDKLNRRDLQILERFYVYARELDLCYEKKLFSWHKASLAKRGERPKEAIAELLRLAAIKNPEHLEKRILKVRNLLFPGQKD